MRPDMPLFDAIMLLESLVIPPLDRCIDKVMKGVIRQTLDRPDVNRYKVGELLRAADQ